MKRICLKLLWLVFLIAPTIQADALTSVELQAEYGGSIDSNKQSLAILITPKDGWHGYWKQPGDIGFPTTISWDLPEGVQISELHYPVPQTYQIKDAMNYVYNGQYALLAEVSVDKKFAVGSQLPISAKLNYLICNESSCVPEVADVSIDLTVVDSITKTARQASFDQYLNALPKPLAVKGSYYLDGDELVVSLPLPENVELISPYLFVEQTDFIEHNAAQSFQHENDRLIIKSKKSEDYEETNDIQAVISMGNGTGLSFVAEKQKPSIDYQLTTILLTFFAAILGGLILNLMPCILPILSMKVMHLAKSSNSKESKSEAIWYAIGVIAMCVSLALVIMISKQLGTNLGWAFQLQSPYMIFALVLLTTAISFNLAGLYEFNSINIAGLNSDNIRTQSFYSGIMTALIATPCSGPFMATALGTALVMPAPIGLIIFAGLGLGIALPFLLVSYVPWFSSLIPKPGAWMLSLRRLLSIPMFITVIALLWVLMRQSTAESLFYALFAIMIISLGFWFTGLRQRELKNNVWRPVAYSLVILLLTFPFFFSAEHSPEIKSETAEKYSQQTLDNYLSANESVFVYFSADWCITCKINEANAINTKETQIFMENNHIKVLKGDWTNGDPEITKALEKYDRTGVPLYLWYKAGASDAIILPQLLSQSDITSLL